MSETEKLAIALKYLTAISGSGAGTHPANLISIAKEGLLKMGETQPDPVNAGAQ